MPFNTAKIPSYSKRQPANIPLHTLSSSSRHNHRRSVSGSGSGSSDFDEKRGRSRRSSFASDSDFSLWSDTGDLGDQLADDEDPLRGRLRESLEGQQPTHPSPTKQKKRVRYASNTGREKEARSLGAPRRKEDIRIPSPPPRVISRGERILAQIMAPRDGPSRIHGLHGKKLMYANMQSMSNWMPLT